MNAHAHELLFPVSPRLTLIRSYPGPLFSRDALHPQIRSLKIIPYGEILTPSRTATMQLANQSWIDDTGSEIFKPNLIPTFTLNCNTTFKSINSKAITPADSD
jgi:hypothetical protein